MATAYEVTLDKIIREFDLQAVTLPKPQDEIFITSADVNRPGLQLAGFFEVFDERRTQVLGESEIVFMNRYTPEEARVRYLEFFKANPPAVILAKGIQPPPEMVEAAREVGIPLLTTTENTSTFISSLILFLNTELAPRITRHGVLVEVYGEGLFIMGDSGVGKSETAIELIKRGHRLVADDAVELRKITDKRLSGTSPDNIRHFLELRGIGIINVRRIFGMGAIKSDVDVDLIINLEQWDPDKVYDRMGMEDTYTEILGVNVPSIDIPVKPGRNIAVIIEVAAMNHRQKKLGYNAAHELLQRLGMMDIDTNWDSF
ncbi:MAG: HPr(Ser) kinase/phosphatase [Clostridiales bacterium]|nr:HPr(Ser) kinase/phosphatase [Clostridiales bacterium]